MGTRTRLGSLALAVVLLVVVFSGAAAAHGGDDGVHHHDGSMGTHDGMGWGMGWGLWFLWPALVLIVAGVGVYLLVARGSDTGGKSDDDALAVLRERYARGEIDEEEFERRRRQLEANSS